MIGQVHVFFNFQRTSRKARLRYFVAFVDWLLALTRFLADSCKTPSQRLANAWEIGVSERSKTPLNCCKVAFAGLQIYTVNLDT